MGLIKKNKKGKFEETLKEYKIEITYDNGKTFETTVETSNIDDFSHKIISKQWLTIIGINKRATINLNKIYCIEYTRIKKGDD